MGDDIPKPEDLMALMDQSAMSAEDKRYVLRSLWAQQEVPEITSSEQYDAYGRWQREVYAKLKAAGITAADPAYARSQDGLLATSIGARMIEWEELQE